MSPIGRIGERVSDRLAFASDRRQSGAFQGLYEPSRVADGDDVFGPKIAIAARRRT